MSKSTRRERRTKIRYLNPFVFGVARGARIYRLCHIPLAIRAGLGVGYTNENNGLCSKRKEEKECGANGQRGGAKKSVYLSRRSGAPASPTQHSALECRWLVHEVNGPIRRRTTRVNLTSGIPVTTSSPSSSDCFAGSMAPLGALIGLAGTSDLSSDDDARTEHTEVRREREAVLLLGNSSIGTLKDSDYSVPFRFWREKKKKR
jgi:hypothetical protein